MLSVRPRVLLLDGMWNKTLAVVRSLGKKGFYVAVGERTIFATALFSRYCNRRVIYPSPVSSPEGFIRWLIKEVKINRYDIVLPTELETQLLILKNREEIERYTRIPFAGYELISNVQDKAWLMMYALSRGYPCPRTFFFDNPNMVRAVKDRIEYPIVIKPRISSGSRGIIYVNDPSKLVDFYMKVHKRYPYPLIQEFIPNGGAYGVGALFNYNSEPRASFVYRRLREYPVTGGPSTLRESVENEEIKEIALSILKSLGWVGVAMVEFRVDSRDGRPKLMEINPRFWGSLQLAILAGIDFPYLLYKLAVDGDVEPVNDYKIGVRCRWLIPGDIMHLLTNPDRFRLNPGFFARTQGDDILSFDDPMPIVGRISSLLPFLYKNEMRRLLLRKGGV